jgi:hypothetical protein
MQGIRQLFAKYVTYKNIYKTGILANGIFELNKYNDKLNEIPSNQNNMDYTLDCSKEFLANSIYGLWWPVTFAEFILKMSLDIDLVTKAN